MKTQLTFRGETYLKQTNIVGTVTVGELYEKFDLVEFFNVTAEKYDFVELPFETKMEKTTGGCYYFDLLNDSFLVFEEELVE